VTIKTTKHHEVSITPDQITLHFGEMDPVIIPRADLRTRLQLIDWVYRLTGWPGMSVAALRALIATVSRHHGWGLADVENATAEESSSIIDIAPHLAAAA
jgi:hypothetical protein